jgi:hypothetical protein
MKYWRWKCQPCGREITIAAGAVPKPCHLCSAWDFLKLGETNSKTLSTEFILEYERRLRAIGLRPDQPATPAKDNLDKS